jgi:hypothetical protein
MMNILLGIQEEMASDDDCSEEQSERLENDYLKLTPDQRRAVDDAFICICGWSLGTLIRKYGTLGSAVNTINSKENL